MHHNQREAQKLELDIANTSKDRPSFSELGTAFEEALHLAEAQAAKLVSDALAEANTISAEAANTVRTLRESTELEISSIEGDASTEASEIALRAEQDASRLRNIVAEESQQIQSELIKVERIAAQLLSDAEREINEIQQRTSREIEDAKRIAIDELRKANEIANAVRFDIHEQRGEADKEIAQVKTLAEAYAARTYVDADNHSEVSVERAASVTLEADEYVTAIKKRADDLMSESRQRAMDLSEHVAKLAAELSESSSEFVAGFTQDLAKQINEARLQQDAMTQLSHSLKVTVNGFDLGELRIERKVATKTDAVEAEIIEE